MRRQRPPPSDPTPAPEAEGAQTEDPPAFPHLTPPGVVLILTGSLNPVHANHLQLLELARAACEEEHGLRVAGALLVPTHVNSLSRKEGQGSRNVASGRHRVRMCELAVADRPWIGVSTALAVGNKNIGAARARDVIEAAVREAFPGHEMELMSVMGADSHEIAGRVLARRQRVALAVNRPVEGFDPDAWAAAHPRAVVARASTDTAPLSATEVRDRVRSGADLSDALAPAVEAYIRTHGLYQGPAPPQEEGEGEGEGAELRMDFEDFTPIPWGDVCRGCHDPADPMAHVADCERLGNGRQGCVVGDVYMDMSVAVKTFDLTAKKRQGKLAEAAFRRELRALSLVSHPHIVRCYGGGWVGRKFAFIVLELAQGCVDSVVADIGHRLPHVWTFADDPSWWLAQCAGVADAMARARQQGVLHRDLTVDNLLLVGQGESLRLALADFGVSQLVGEPRSIRGNVPRYAPEAARNDEPVYDSSCDVFMMGVCLFELAHGFSAFDAGQAKSAVFQRTARGGRPSPTVAAPPEFWDIVRDCWAQDPERRPTFAELGDRLRDLIMQLVSPDDHHDLSTETSTASTVMSIAMGPQPRLDRDADVETPCCFSCSVS